MCQSLWHGRCLEQLRTTLCLSVCLSVSLSLTLTSSYGSQAVGTDAKSTEAEEAGDDAEGEKEEDTGMDVDATSAEGEEKTMVIFENGSANPATKLVSFQRAESFEIRAEYTSQGDLPEGCDTFIGKFTISGIDTEEVIRHCAHPKACSYYCQIIPIQSITMIYFAARFRERRKRLRPRSSSLRMV